jgi:hypothetical protein
LAVRSGILKELAKFKAEQYQFFSGAVLPYIQFRYPLATSRRLFYEN